MSRSVGSMFNMKIHKPQEACDLLVLPFAKVGVEIECENVTKLKRLDDWNNHEDNSLRGRGMEFTTKGGLVGAHLVTAIESACTTFNALGYSEGYPRAGIHLHIDVTDMNETSSTQLLNMVLSYMLFEKAMFKWAGQWREACGFCDPLYMSQKDFPSIGELLYDWDSDAHLNGAKMSDSKFSKYQAVNFLPLARFGTLEFRHLPTTFDSKRILDWINLCLCFKHYGMVCDNDPVTYMDHYGIKDLIHKVFGKYLPIIEHCIDQDEVLDSVLDVRALLVGKGKARMLDSWDLPDSPLLLKKATKPKKEHNNEQGIEAVPPEQRPVRVTFNRPVRGQWDIFHGPQPGRIEEDF